MGWDGGMGGRRGCGMWVWGGMMGCDDISDQGCVNTVLVMGLRVWGLGFDISCNTIDESGDQVCYGSLFGELKMGCLLGLVASR